MFHLTLVFSAVVLLTRLDALEEEAAALSSGGRTRDEGRGTAPMREETSPEAAQETDPLTLWHQLRDVTESRPCSRLYSVYPKLPHHWLS